MLDYLCFCPESVRRFAERNGYIYIKKNTPIFNTMNKYRIYSEIERLKFLAEKPYRIWFDWDVYVTENFRVKDLEQPVIDFGTRESIIYNGNSINIFKDMLNNSGSNPHVYLLFTLFKKMRIRPSREYFEKGTYYHFSMTTFRKYEKKLREAQIKNIIEELKNV